MSKLIKLSDHGSRNASAYGSNINIRYGSDGVHAVWTEYHANLQTKYVTKYATLVGEPVSTPLAIGAGEDDH